MTWQEASTVARQLVSRELARRAVAHPEAAAQLGADMDFIRLADYPDEATYEALNEGVLWTWTFHRMVNKAAARQLRAAGFRAKIVTLGLKEYRDWLARERRPHGRASCEAFITWKCEVAQ